MNEFEKLAYEIDEYYQKRGLVWPKPLEALMWAYSEIREVVIEIENGDKDAEAEEWGDVLMMVYVTALVAEREEFIEKLHDDFPAYRDYVTFNIATNRYREVKPLNRILIIFGNIAEQLLAREREDWVRNNGSRDYNPDKFLRLIISAAVAIQFYTDLDPMAALRAKMARKLAKLEAKDEQEN